MVSASAQCAQSSGPRFQQQFSLVGQGPQGSTGSTGFPDWLTDLLIALLKKFLIEGLTFIIDAFKTAEIERNPPGLLGVVVGGTSLRSVDDLGDVLEAPDPLGPGLWQSLNRMRL